MRFVLGNGANRNGIRWRPGGANRAAPVSVAALSGRNRCDPVLFDNNIVISKQMKVIVFVARQNPARLDNRYIGHEDRSASCGARRRGITWTSVMAEPYLDSHRRYSSDVSDCPANLGACKEPVDLSSRPLATDAIAVLVSASSQARRKHTMREIDLQRRIPTERSDVWNVLADFPNISVWNGGIKKSFSTSEAMGGVGATRHCDLSP